MGLNSDGLSAVLNDGNEVVMYAAVGDGATSADEVSGNRVLVAWSAPVSQVITAANTPLSFSGGTPGGAATHLLLFSQVTAGTFYGYATLSGDQVFNANGEFNISALSIMAADPDAIPPGFPDEFNTGLAGVGMTVDDLTAYSGPGGYDSGGPYLIEDQLIFETDIRILGPVSITMRRCKIENGHVDVDHAGGSLVMEDCWVDARAWTNAAVGFQNLTITRCNIEGGITAVNASTNVTVTDSYLHGQVIREDQPDHAGGFLCSGGGNITLDHCTIWCSAEDNGFGGGPSNNLNLFGDFSELDDITTTGCYFPVTGGGYSVSLGWNPGKPYGDTPSNIVFTGNVLARDAVTGKGGIFGTVTSFLDTDPSNVYSDNVWADDGTPVPVNA